MTSEQSAQQRRAADRPIKVILPTGFGINCEAETAHAFQLAGAKVETIHVNELALAPAKLAKAHILALAGGFAFGDHLGAGRVFANRIRARLGHTLDGFFADGGLAIGICNGFQTMVRLGLLPGSRIGAQQISLAENHHGTFYDGWVTLGADPASPCLFTRDLERMDLPARHGEGRLLAAPETLGELESKRLVPLRYLDPQGEETQEFPYNPNGSELCAAAACDESGRIFGLMPHPEAFLYPENHPQWRHRPSKTRGEGLQIFENAVAGARGI